MGPTYAVFKCRSYLSLLPHSCKPVRRIWATSPAAKKQGVGLLDVVTSCQWSRSSVANVTRQSLHRETVHAHQELHQPEQEQEGQQEEASWSQGWMWDRRWRSTEEAVLSAHRSTTHDDADYLLPAGSATPTGKCFHH